MKNRPKGIIIMAIIMFLAAVIALIIGISIIIPGTPLDVLWTIKNSFPSGFISTFMGMIFGIFLLVLFIIGLITVWGFINGRKWAWWIIVIMLTVNGIGDMANLALGSIDGIVGILIAIGFLFYLTRPGVKAFFEKGSKKTN